jgi:hypothetical protein
MRRLFWLDLVGCFQWPAHWLQDFDKGRHHNDTKCTSDHGHHRGEKNSTCRRQATGLAQSAAESNREADYQGIPLASLFAPYDLETA